MEIYKITHSTTASYEYYDSMVVIAENKGQAIHISLERINEYGGTSSLGELRAKLIGRAEQDAQAGVVVASYNAA